MTARIFPASEGHTLGLITRLCDTVLVYCWYQRVLINVLYSPSGVSRTLSRRAWPWPVSSENGRQMQSPRPRSSFKRRGSAPRRIVSTLRPAYKRKYCCRGIRCDCCGVCAEIVLSAFTVCHYYPICAYCQVSKAGRNFGVKLPYAGKKDLST